MFMQKRFRIIYQHTEQSLYTSKRYVRTHYIYTRAAPPPPRPLLTRLAAS